MGFRVRVRAAKEELQRLKPALSCCVYVAVETATYKDSRVTT
jgi:hypothetical protein